VPISSWQYLFKELAEARQSFTRFILLGLRSDALLEGKPKVESLVQLQSGASLVGNPKVESLVAVIALAKLPELVQLQSNSHAAFLVCCCPRAVVPDPLDMHQPVASTLSHTFQMNFQVLEQWLADVARLGAARTTAGASPIGNLMHSTTQLLQWTCTNQH
jgi:hypothetical protein